METTTTIYKLTRRDGTTYNGFKWIPGEWYETSGEGELCGPGWLHAYTDPVLAEMLNAIHANISTDNMILWEGEATGICKTDLGLKVGYTRMRILREIPLRHPTIEQRVRFAIGCAKRVCADPVWIAWADRWLTGLDRTADAADTAGSARMGAAAGSAARSAAAAAQWAAAGLAARSAAAGSARMGAAARSAAAAAARSAADSPLDLAAIAQSVMERT